MKSLIQLEEVFITAAAIYFLSIYNLGLSFWIWIPLFFAPDLSMLGYWVNTKVGAFTYNLFHHRGVALLLAGIGYYFHQDILCSIGILLFAHSSFDRMLGYGLKYDDDFKHTHLGHLGKPN